eukprot:CAMPEP_0170847230 /NCGR_PEP_ID=MMETSP0734-20130129/8656_1 /TAXON_ID=186038 /ORGANISM="Fragilariopsis kerguelensis, Strain L26-C5" /LENGTH=53 /DNA_ID=CAMNT_0011216403 /DNA_START=189 /DNA_END=346 /DNA_ORIENTATION=-
MKGKPGGRKTTATADIQKGMHPQDFNHILPHSRTGAAGIKFSKPSQMFGITLP